MVQTAAMFVASLVAGIVQGLTGFGSNICMMTTFPLFYSIPTAAGVSMVVSMAVNAQMTYAHRKQIMWRPVLLLSAIAIVVACIVIHFSVSLDAKLAKRAFGVLFVLFCLYFLFIKRDTAHGHPLGFAASAALILVGAVIDGLFGVGGPPMVIWFMAASRDHGEYVGSINAYFLITAIFYTIYRFIEGVLVPAHIPLALLCIAGIVLGGYLGNKLVGKLNHKVVEKLVYIGIGVAGIMNII